MKKIHFIFLKCLLMFKHYDISHSLIISSEPRSGSTWLMEMLLKIEFTITNSEPLHVTGGPVPPRLNWGWRPFIKENDNNDEFREEMEKILTLKTYNQWTLGYNQSILKALRSKMVLTRFCRAHLSLPWMVNQFQFNYKPIYLIRHPIAVALSQIENFHINKPFSEYVIPECINNERYINNFAYLNNLKTNLERQIATWCIHNVEIINHPRRQEWIPIFYEDLILNPEANLNRISEEWNLKINMDSINFSTPSASNYLNSFQADKMKQLSKWKKRLSSDELLKIQAIFDHYNLKIYHTSSVLPIL